LINQPALLLQKVRSSPKSKLTGIPSILANGIKRNSDEGRSKSNFYKGEQLT